MRLARHAAQPDPAEQQAAVVPAVLPQVIAMLDDAGSARVAVDGIERLDGPVSRDELGGLLAEIAEKAGGPVRVEVREPDGSRYADILQPQPRPPEPRKEQDARTEEPALRGEGFLPGEPVLVAVVATTIHAGPDGTASLTDTPGSGGEVVLFGSVSGTIVRADLPARPNRRWWRR